jgi:hypothetical protein
VENQIVRNAIHDLGAGGIKISNGSEVRASYDDAPSKKKGKEWEGLGNPRNDAHGNVVSDNTVKDGAKTYMGAVGVWVGHSSGNQIAHNEISGPWQFAVSVGWNWHYTPPSLARDNVIEYNHVHHIGGLLKSHSTLYTLGIQPGTVLQYNVVHDSSGYGLAFDECSTCILAENNLVYRQAAGGLHFNRNCLGNIVQNNIFALNGDAKQGQLTRYGDQPLGKEDTNCNVFMRNIVYWHDSRLWNEKRWSNDRVIHDFNLYWDTSGKPIEPLGLSWEEWTKKSPTFGFHIDSHSIIGDPLFVDPQNDDFRLQAESPASQIGFRPFDLSTVGPRGKTPSK